MMSHGAPVRSIRSPRRRDDSRAQSAAGCLGAGQPFARNTRVWWGYEGWPRLRAWRDQAACATPGSGFPSVARAHRRLHRNSRAPELSRAEAPGAHSDPQAHGLQRAGHSTHSARRQAEWRTLRLPRADAILDGCSWAITENPKRGHCNAARVIDGGNALDVRLDHVLVRASFRLIDQSDRNRLLYGPFVTLWIFGVDLRNHARAGRHCRRDQALRADLRNQARSVHLRHQCSITLAGITAMQAL